MHARAPRISFATARDGYRFAVRRWDVEKPLGRVVFLHGIVSHGGWYLSSSAHLAQSGLEVHFLDRRGSGVNPQDRGHVDRFQTWLSDVEDYLEGMGGSLPRILLGISWGGTLAAAVARHRPDLLAGVGFLCPGLFSRKSATAAQRAGIRLACLLGLRRLRVGIPLRDPALFTNNPKARAYIAGDPLALWTMTLAFAAANLDLCRYATEAPEEIRVAPLAMLAELDPITENDQVRRFVERISHPRKKIIEYPGASHTLEFEPDPAQYYADLASWCREIAGA